MGVRSIGYSGDVQSLWENLAKEPAKGHSPRHRTKTGKFLYMVDLAPVEGKLMEEFRQKLLDTHNGSYVHAWKETLNPSGSGVVTLAELQAAMQRVGFNGHLPAEKQNQLVKSIFEFLDYDFSGTITLDEVDVNAARSLARGDDKVFGIDCDAPTPVRTSQTFLARQRNHNGYIRMAATSKYRRAMADEEVERQKLYDMGASDLVGFKDLLTRKYGNLYRAWKLGLDPDGNGRVGQTEFFEAARRVGYKGSAKTLWRETVKDDEEGILRLRHLHEEAAAATEKFTELILKNYGTWLAAWVREFDVNRSGRCTKDDFIRILNKVNYPYSGERLFHWLDYDASGSITLEEIDVEAHHALRRGDHKYLRKDGKMGQMSPNEKRKTSIALAKLMEKEKSIQKKKAVTLDVVAERPATAPGH